MLQVKISILLLLGLVLMAKALPVEEKSQNSDSESTSNEQDIEMELLKTIRKGIMAEMLLRERLDNQIEESEEYAPKEKRFPKWRSGETRSKVKLLHQNNEYQNHQSNDYSPVLRKIWENNMLEKNKLYQSLLG